MGQREGMAAEPRNELRSCGTQPADHLLEQHIAMGMAQARR